MSISENIWRSVVLPPTVSIREGIAKLNESGLQILLIVDDQYKLIGTVTDGDIRRSLLRGQVLNEPIEKIMRRNSIVVASNISRETVLQLMRTNRFHQLPIVDHLHRVVGLHLWNEITLPKNYSNQMIIMAGGLGKRLRPYTEKCPKPMLAIHGKPILEHIIERARAEGFCNFTISVQYLGEMIEEYFGNGEKFGVKIGYVKENSPLGTAGALSLLNPRPQHPIIVTNGDVLSDIRYGDLLDFHSRYSAFATMAVRLYEWHNPYGVVKTDGITITGFEEKPMIRSYINAGVYALNPEILEFINYDEPCDMPSLFEYARRFSKKIIAYPMHEPWLDIGNANDLIEANLPTRV